MLANPFREGLGRPTRPRPQVETPFRSIAEQALASFRGVRTEAERRVRTGDLTPKSAREEVAIAAAALREELNRRSKDFSPVTSVFADRLAEGASRRSELRKRRGLEELQRETIDLLRRGLIEQQITARAVELESSTHSRPIAGGAPVTSVERMLNFHEESVGSGDEAASEWARRQLEKLRSRVLDPADEIKIDRATRQPDRVNERLVAATLQDLEGRADTELEVFVTYALESGDATDLVTAFVLARRAIDPIGRPWVRRILEAVERFPDATLAALSDWEARERTAESEAARVHADYAAELAEVEARLHGLRGPTDAELARMSRLAQLPLSAPSVRPESLVEASNRSIIPADGSELNPHPGPD